MEVQKIIATALIINLLAMTGSALEEIAQQSVGYGDYIKQYAIVEFVTEQGMSYREYCSDCSAYITIKQELKTLINDTEMVNLSTGLYGYKVTTYLNFNQTYDIQVHTVSPLYGNSSVYSQATIDNKQKSITPTVGTSGLAGDILNPEQQKILEFIQEEFIWADIGLIFGEEFKDTIKAPFDDNSLLGALNGFGKGTINFLTDSLTFFGEGTTWLIRLGNSDTRAGAITDFITLFKNVFITFLKVLLVPIIIYELFILLKVTTTPGVRKISRIIEININSLNQLMNLVSQVYNLFFNMGKFIVESVLKIVGIIVPW